MMGAVLQAASNTVTEKGGKVFLGQNPEKLPTICLGF